MIFGNIHQPRRIQVGKRFDKSGIYEGKNGNACRGAQGQNENGNDCESWILPQLAQRVPEILERSFKLEPHYLIALLFETRIVSQLARRRIVSRIQTHAFCLQPLLRFRIISHAGIGQCRAVAGIRPG